jgi:hypothetical protein
MMLGEIRESGGGAASSSIFAAMVRKKTFSDFFLFPFRSISPVNDIVMSACGVSWQQLFPFPSLYLSFWLGRLHQRLQNK